MTALKFASPRARWAMLFLAVCVAFVVFAAVVGSAAAAGKALSTINLCITKAGPEKGVVRFAATKHCRKGETLVQVVGGSDVQGVLGVQEESGQQGGVGEKAPPGDKGPIGDKGPVGLQGPTGEKGPTGDRGPTGEGILIAGLTTSDASTSSISYMGPFVGSTPTSTELNAQQIVPFAGTIANFAFKIDVAPGSGNNYTVTVRKNGVAGSPAITCKIEGTGSINTSCLDSAHSLSFAAGDLLSVQIGPNSNPEKWGGARWSATLTP
jgi:hypothetical protein